MGEMALEKQQRTGASGRTSGRRHLGKESSWFRGTEKQDESNPVYP